MIIIQFSFIIINTDSTAFYFYFYNFCFIVFCGFIPNNLFGEITIEQKDIFFLKHSLLILLYSLLFFDNKMSKSVYLSI